MEKEGQGREWKVGFVLMERCWGLEGVLESSPSQLNGNINNQHLLSTYYMLDTRLALDMHFPIDLTLLYEVLLLSPYYRKKWRF